MCTIIVFVVKNNSENLKVFAEGIGKLSILTFSVSYFLRRVKMIPSDFGAEKLQEFLKFMYTLLTTRKSERKIEKIINFRVEFKDVNIYRFLVKYVIRTCILFRRYVWIYETNKFNF